MQFPLKMTLAEIEKIRVSKEYAELCRKVQELDDARAKAGISFPVGG